MRLTAWLSDWPVTRPRNWVVRVNRLETGEELEALCLSVQRGRPFGDDAWVRKIPDCHLWLFSADPAFRLLQ